MPSVGSLFSGIGGIDLGLERAGFTTAWQVEWDGYCQRVLAKHWPDVPRYGDITTVDFTTLERVDLLAGGFPCQPVSSAGKQRAQADARWLWPEFERAIRDLRPRHVLVENVRNLLRVNDGSAFAEVLGGLASLGYDAEWRCIRASDVGAPHGRDRLWIVAHADGERREMARHAEHGCGPDCKREASDRASRGDDRGSLADADEARRGESGEGDARSKRGAGWHAARDRSGELADASSERVEGHRPDRQQVARVPARETLPGRDGAGRGAGDGPAEPGMGRGAHGLSGGLDGHRWPAPPGPQYAWEPPRVAVGIVNRRPRLQGLGNAVVPQIVTLLGAEILACPCG